MKGGEGGKAVGIERYITYITQCVAVSTKFSDIMVIKVSSIVLFSVGDKLLIHRTIQCW